MEAMKQSPPQFDGPAKMRPKTLMKVIKSAICKAHWDKEQGRKAYDAITEQKQEQPEAETGHQRQYMREENSWADSQQVKLKHHFLPMISTARPQKKARRWTREKLFLISSSAAYGTY
jgi:hypothetical protein